MKTHNPEIGPDGWDKEDIYDNEIAPLMSQIIEICRREKIPMMASLEYRHSDDTGDGEHLCCTTHLPGPDGKFNEMFGKAVRDIRTPSPFVALTITQPK